MEHISKILKSQIKRKVKLTQALLVIFLITNSIGYGEENVNIKNEKFGLELGDDSRARGIGSISTGRKGIAIGTNAVATGENETKESIERKLEENRQKLEEIRSTEKEVINKTEELRLKKLRESETIEAGIRVEEINKAKEKAKTEWQNKLNTYNTEKENSKTLLEDYNNKINDLNSRLNAVKDLGSFDIKSDQGLEAAAVKLKEKVEEGTNLRLETSFYKDYVVNHYKVLGDLRVNELIWSKSRGNSDGLTFENYKLLKANDALKKDLTDLIIPNSSPKTSSYAASSDTASSYSHPYTYKSGSSSSSYYSTSYSSASSLPGGWEYNVLGGYTLQKIGDTGLEGLYSKGKDDNEWVNDTVYDIDGIKINTYVNIDVDLTSKENYDNWVSVKDKWKNKIHEYNARLGDQFLGKVDTLTGGKSTEYYNMVTDLKFELVDLDKQITYYQWEYEQEKDKNPIKANEWLDKKNEAVKIRKDRIDNNSKKLFEKGKELGFYTGEYDSNTVLNGIDYMIGKKYYGAWKKENIDDPKEKNKISINTLTSELERELNINKEEVIKKEKELETLLKESNQAEINYNSINPNESDVVVAKKYEEVKAEIEKLTADLNDANTRLTNLKNALTLNDLKNIGENQIAIGTETLAVGNNTIAMGYKAISVGKDTVSIGARNQSTGQAITALGQDLVTNGNNNISIGNTNVINGENNIVFGRNNNVGALGDANKSNGNIVLGNGITVSKDITNSITLGDSSTPVSNAISVGSANNERQIKNVKDATDDQDAVTYKQLKDKLDDKANKDLSNVDKNTIITKVGDGNLDNTNGGLVKDTVVKEKLDNLKNDIDTKLNNKANASDLGSYLKLDGTNADSDDKRIALASKLSENSSLTDPKGILVTDTLVKQGLDGKLNKDLSNLDETKINEKLAKGNITSTDITVTGGDNSTFKDVTLELSTALKDKINSVDDKANKDEVYTKDQTNTKIDEKINAIDLSGFAKTDASNIQKDKYTTKLSEGASLTSPTGALVTDTLVKQGLDDKANKDLSNVDKNTIITKVGDGNLDNTNGGLVKDTVVKEKLDNLKNDIDTKLNNKANASDLGSYLKLDGTNADSDDKRIALASKLSENSSLTDPKGILVTDTLVKQGLDGKLNKDLSNLDETKINEKLAKGNITSTDITVTGGDNSTFKDVTLELSTALKDKINSVDDKANKDEVYTKDQTNTKIDEKINAIDLSGFAKTDASNIQKDKYTTKLSEDASLTSPTGALVTDTLVKQGLDGKLNKDLSNLDETKINEKLAKGNITSTDITVTGGDNSTFKDVTLNLSEALKNKINSVDDKLNKKGDNLTNDEKITLLKNLGLDNIPTVANLDNKLNKNGDNLEKEAFTTNLTKGANIDTPTNTVVTDKMVKDKLDSMNTDLGSKLDNKANKDLSNLTNEDKGKARTNLDVYSKSETDNKLNEKADKSDLTKYVKLDGSNIDKTAKDKLTEKLSEAANLDTPTNTLVTDTIVKTKLDNLKTDLDNKLDKKANASDVYTKNELDAKLKNTVAPKAEGDILSDTLEITNGKDRLIGKEDVKIELKDKSVSKEKLSDELTKNIDNKANINGNNIVNKKDKEDFRNNIDVYSKNEIDSKISNISTETNLDGEVKENEEKGVKGKVIDKHLKENYVHKNDMQIRDKVIISNSAEIQANKEAIKANAKEIKRVDAKINKVAAISQATASLDWGQISVGNVGVGASIAQYSNETGIAVGVAYRPTDNFFMNMKWTGLAGEPHYNSIGASATYQFNLK